MKRLVLHAGLPKTASSALQVFFAQQHDQLLQQSINYPKLGDFALGQKGQIGSGNGAYLSRALLSDNHPIFLKNNYRAAIDNWIKAIKENGNETILCSSEFFVEADEIKMRDFIEIAKREGYQTQIAIYTRRQDSWLNSSYIQQVKRHGMTDSVDAFIINSYQHIRILNYASIITYLQGIYGSENVKVMPLEIVRSQYGSIYQHFLSDFLNCHNPAGFDLGNTKIVNPSLSLKALKIMLEVNNLKPPMRFSDFLLNADSRVMSGSEKNSKYSLIDKKLSDTLQEYFLKENEGLGNLIGRPGIYMEPWYAGHEDIEKVEIGSEDTIRYMYGMMIEYYHRLERLEQQMNKHSL